MATFYIVNNGTVGTPAAGNTGGFPQLNATGTINAHAGDVFIVDGKVDDSFSFGSATGTPVAFTVSFQSSNTSGQATNGATLTFNDNTIATVNVATGADVNNFRLSAGSSDGITVHAGDNAQVGSITGSATGDTITGGNGASFQQIATGAGADTIVLGDTVTIVSGVTGGAGSVSLTAGDNLTVSSGGIDFGTKSGAVVDIGDTAQFTGTLTGALDSNAWTIGAGATGGSISFGASGATSGANDPFSLSIGSDSQFGSISIPGSDLDVTLTLGDRVSTGAISIGGSNSTQTVAIGQDAAIGSNLSMGGSGNVITLSVGDGTAFNNSIFMGGSNNTQTVTLGDNVSIGASFAMGGANNINHVTIGDGFDLGSTFSGSTSGTESIFIGDNWVFGGTINLQGGNDTFRIGTSGDTGNAVSGGSGTGDHLDIYVPEAKLAAFTAAATAAGWTDLGNGQWDTNNKTLSFGGTSYSNFESASVVVCFAAGTLIATPYGPVAVEDLAVGDLVRTLDHGDQAVRWIGTRRLDGIDLAAAPRLRPVRIAAGALGPGLPQRDLVVSPQHRLLVRSAIARAMFAGSDVLVPACKLVGLPGIDIVGDCRAVLYVHLLFDRHEIVFAEGAAAESLLTGPQALAALPRAARAEIAALGSPTTTPARPIPPTGRHMRQLVARHARLGAPICG